MAKANLDFEIVPGVSSAYGAAAYAGIPLTHREDNFSLSIFSGHQQMSKEHDLDELRAIAQAPGSKVMLMGMNNLEKICQHFISFGLAENLPVALVRFGTRNFQKVLHSNLKNISNLAKNNNFSAPSIVIFGEIVKKAELLGSWFGKGELFGKKIIVTRTRKQASALSRKLMALGAEPIELPLIRISDPKSADIQETFKILVEDAHRYDWLVFTSPNGVDKFFEKFYQRYLDAREIGGVKIAAIGPGTAKKVLKYRLTVDLLPDKNFVSEGLIDAFKKSGSIENQTILLVKAKETRNYLAENLTKMGAIVDQAVAYETLAEKSRNLLAWEFIEEEGADFITFTSSSTVRNFFNLDFKLPKNCKIASIGPITSAEIKKFCKKVDIESERHSIDGLVSAIRKFYSKK